MQTLDRETRPERPIAQAPVVTAHDLTRQYGSGETAVHALSGVSVEVESGQHSLIFHLVCQSVWQLECASHTT